MSVIDTAVYLDGELVARASDPFAAIHEARSRGGLVWIGLRRTDAAELQVLADLLRLHPLAVRDCLRGHQRAKLEKFGEMAFLVLQPAQYHDDTETVEVSEVDLFVGPDYIVTVQEDDAVDTDAVRARLETHPEVLRRGSYGIVWALIEEVINGYRPVTDGVENDIDEIEAQLLSEQPQVSHRIFALQREVIDLQHATTPLVDMLEQLEQVVADREAPLRAEALRLSRERAQHVVERVDGFRHTLESALTVHATLVEQQNNESMRRMTEQSLLQNDQVKKISSWAAIGLAPTVITGIYGMNFRYMPELDQPWGYPFALGLMIAVSSLLYVVFKKRDWL
ncbi:magnesium and cobalt transport protein CorA [Microbacterium fluvii]|uniref:Magnesium and cobalt transport protein CorA n=1 Tax=Microbacterium fluvii TaxID=415215 RepID=A0ABW2HH07_9MICO|nr:magnesium and cobalt transport protein CorA [Microbacterium fluvii]MCU4672368.1 magnesium and cobalt transport protein CorA [Microbacterium fluvii]